MKINDKNGLLKVMDNLLEELDQNAAGPELEKAAELDNEATLEKAPSELVSDINNEDVYGDDEEFAEDVGEVVVESEQNAAGPELDGAKELENEATEEGEAEELTSDIDNEDVYGDDEEFAEDVGGVVVESLTEDDLYDILEQNGYELTEENVEILREGLLKGEFILEAEGPELDGAKELENEATEESEAEELTSDIDNKEVYSDEEHEQKEDVGAVIVTERSLAKANNVLAGHDKKTAITTAKAMPTKPVAGDTRTKAEVKAERSNAIQAAKKTYDSNAIHKYGKNGIMTGAGAAAEGQRQAAENAVTAAAKFDAKQAKARNNAAVATAKAERKGAIGVAKETAKSAGGVAKAQASGAAKTLKFNKKKAASDQKALEVRNNARIARNAENASVAGRQEAANATAASKRKEELKAAKDREATARAKGKVQAKAQARRDLDAKIAAGGKGSGWAKFRKRIGLYENASDIELLELLEANGYEADLENLLLLKEGLADGTYFLYEEELETEVMPAEAEEKGVADDEAAERGEDKEDSEKDEKEDKEEEKKEDEEKEEVNEAFDSIFALINQINESLSQNAAGPELDGAKELENEATEEGDAKELTSDIDNKEVYDAEEHEQKEDVGEVVVESEQNAAGPELDGAKELENEATEEREEKVAEQDTDNKDVYCDATHKQVEDVVEVVVEAVSACKAKGIPATLANITNEAKALFESDEVKVIGKPSEKNYDVDAAIESSEMNGNDEKFEDYDKIKGQGAKAALTAQVPANAIHESVKYKSLKEACMLDEDYFEVDSYVKETASEKKAKLTEQVSLLMAREANDPLYDELLKESAYCMRLREQIQNKYGKDAGAKVNVIIEK